MGTLVYRHVERGAVMRTRTQSGAGKGGSGIVTRWRQAVGAKYAARENRASRRVRTMRGTETWRYIFFIASTSSDDE